MPRQQLGILTLYLNNSGLLEERKIYEQMTIEAAKLDISIIVFTPAVEDVNYHEQIVRAHIFDRKSKRWLRRWVPIPNLVFDRCRIQKTLRMSELRKFKEHFPHIQYLNRTFSNKWTVYQKLLESPHIKRYLPHTIKYTQHADILKMLKLYKVIYVKPVNGTGGRGILRIERQSALSVKIEGRNHDRRIITPRILSNSAIRSFMNNWNVQSMSYLIQQGLDLTLDNGRVHDYRILVQKDGTGSWNVTGGAGRIGAERSITANLHGGGSAVAMRQLIESFVEPGVNLSLIQEEINNLSLSIANFLEQNHYTLCEIAVDIAIDREGNIWLIEINPKPSREVFREIGDHERYLQAIRRPIEYAKYLTSLSS